MSQAIYPGQLNELDFVEAYARSALKKPEMAADAALRTLVFAEAGGRAILVGLIAQELAEASRRLVAVYNALGDRQHPVGKSLMRPLPGAADWRAFIQQSATQSAEQMVRSLFLGDDALEAARILRSQPDLSELSGLVAAAETGNPMLLIPGLSRRYIPDEVWLAGIDRAGEPIASSFGAEEGDAVTLADLTGDICAIARGFLLSYVNARRNAGKQE
ncbi:MAG TPA: hypothetical protein PKD27_01225 [Tepidiformaceae bacterium]|nr:hypothetical protein [Tepidiformaceae bacterium]